MRFYYCTGIEDFKQVVQDGAILSDYEKLRRVDETTALSSLEGLTEREKMVHQNLVLLTDNQSRYGRKGSDVRLEFELKTTPIQSQGPVYINVQEVDLTQLMSITYTKRVEEEVVKILHGTPYENIRIKPFFVPQETYRRERVPRPVIRRWHDED